MRRYIVVFIILAALLTGCEQPSSQKGASLDEVSKVKPLHDDKKVVVLVIDSITEKLLQEGLKQSAIPALSFLMENGNVYHDVIAPFPSMSVVTESNLLTGTTTNKHRVPGLIRYDEQLNELIIEQTNADGQLRV